MAYTKKGAIKTMANRRTRDERIMLTVTAEEKAKIEQAANKADMSTTAYCRNILLPKNPQEKAGDDNGKL